MLRQLALSGVGIANLMTYQVRDDLRAGRLVELLPRFRPTQGIPLYAVYHDRRNLNARIRCFVDFLADIEARVIPLDPGPLADVVEVLAQRHKS